MSRLSKKLFYTIGITFLCCSLQAQSLDQAKKLYNEGQYAEAKPDWWHNSNSNGEEQTSKGAHVFWQIKTSFPREKSAYSIK